MNFRLLPTRAPIVAADAMVASSQTRATLAAVQVLGEGGNAVDAALCAAAVLCVTEPHATGVGGDLFAMVRTAEGQLFALDAAGPAPWRAPAERPARSGPRSITVPGAVAGWGELSTRFGRLGLDRCIGPAVDAAKRGVAVGFESAHNWRQSERAPSEFGRPPRFGERYTLPALGTTLERIEVNGPDEVYRGATGEGDRPGVMA
jgi:gamma-glutamyltranspeptidase / glutathione hydrolase